MQIKDIIDLGTRCLTQRAIALLPSHKLWLGLDDCVGWWTIPHLAKKYIQDLSKQIHLHWA